MPGLPTGLCFSAPLLQYITLSLSCLPSLGNLCIFVLNSASLCHFPRFPAQNIDIAYHLRYHIDCICVRIYKSIFYLRIPTKELIV